MNRTFSVLKALQFDPSLNTYFYKLHLKMLKIIFDSFLNKGFNNESMHTFTENNFFKGRNFYQIQFTFIGIENLE